MKRFTPLAALLIVALPLAAMPLAGCEQKKPASTTKKADDHDHDHDHDHGHGGAAIALGEQTAGSFTVKASRVEGQIVAGKDAPIDAIVAATGTAKVAAVRFWIGTEDAKGSVKAKAEIEDPKDPNRWHTHAEIPNPLPEGSKLWIEIEDDKGAKSVAGFDLKR